MLRVPPMSVVMACKSCDLPHVCYGADDRTATSNTPSTRLEHWACLQLEDSSGSVRAVFLAQVESLVALGGGGSKSSISCSRQTPGCGVQSNLQLRIQLGYPGVIHQDQFLRHVSLLSSEP
jgi:hypothetical protein